MKPPNGMSWIDWAEKPLLAQLNPYKTVEKMTDTLSPEAIAYIVAWKQSGNEPRPLEDVWAVGCCIEHVDIDTERLSLAGLTIAAQAEEIARLKKLAGEQ